MGHDTEALTERRLLEGLDRGQRRAVESEASPLCILAGAGSGKTRVLTRRIAYRILTGRAEAAHVLALTFTRKAAGELRHRLGQLGARDQVAAGTFHAIAYAQLRRRWADRGERPPALLESKARLLGPMLARGARSAARPVAVADAATEIEWAKARMVPPAHYEEAVGSAGRTPPLPADQMAALYQRYEDEKRRRGLVDFDDLLAMCAFALEAEPEFAAAQRWRFRHLFVDEYQDVNPVQHRLLMAWLGDRRDLCVVGDPRQAIYSWNGADPRFLTDFSRSFPDADVVTLDHNYRSPPQVLATAAAVLGVRPLRATRPEGPPPVIRAYDSDRAEAHGVARSLRRAHRPGGRWADLAVLARTNAQAALFEEALRAAGIPYRVRGGGFLQQPEVREALDQLAAAPPAFPLRARLADLEHGLGDSALPPERRLQVEALIRLGQEYIAVDPEGSAAGFRAWLAATMRGEHGGGGDAVEIATFHRAKGLEWPVVFVTGLEKGLVPIGHATSGEAEAEERRLLYVALTRAQRELHCSWAKERTFGTRTVRRSPSPWLRTIEHVRDALAAGTPADQVDWRARIRAEQERLRAGAGAKAGKGASTVAARRAARCDPELLAALKHWRLTAARAASVPAYVIFHDSTLVALADARPTSKEELLEVPGLGPVKAARYGDALLAVLTKRSA